LHCHHWSSCCCRHCWVQRSDNCAHHDYSSTNHRYWSRMYINSHWNFKVNNLNAPKDMWHSHWSYCRGNYGELLDDVDDEERTNSES
jgi:hypothetical protein